MPHSSRQTLVHNMTLSEIRLHLLHMSLSLFIISLGLKHLNTTYRSSSGNAVMRKILKLSNNGAKALSKTGIRHCKVGRKHGSSDFLTSTIFSSLFLFVFQGVPCHQLSCIEEIISESVILLRIFLLVDIKSGFLAIMKNLLFKRLNSPHQFHYH